MVYTARFSEQWELVDFVYGDAVAAATETNTGQINIGNYIRLVVIIHPVDVNDALDVDIEQAASSTGVLKALDSNSKDITVATADTKPSVIEIRPDEFDVANGYEYLNVEVTTANTGGNGNDFAVEIWGEPVYKPAATTNLDSVTD